MTSKKILIVDDEAELVGLVKIRLETAGYEVLKAFDGQEGLDKAKLEKPDLILLDIMMPKMDGYKVCGLLKMDARFKKIPIILFSAKAQKEDAELAKEIGADLYITKPFEASVLLAKIRELLGE